MKMSEAMLKGYAKVGKQCVGRFREGDPRHPTAVCALGAVALQICSDANNWDTDWYLDARTKFLDYFGVRISDANDVGLDIETIAGMLQHIGE